MKELPKVSVSEQLAEGFARVPASLPAGVATMCDAVLTDIAGLCVAARSADFVQASVAATSEAGAP